MSTGLIIAIVVVAIILLAVLFFIPRMRGPKQTLSSTLSQG